MPRSAADSSSKHIRKKYDLLFPHVRHETLNKFCENDLQLNEFRVSFTVSHGDLRHQRRQTLDLLPA